MRRTTKYAQRRPNEEARQQTQVFGKPLESVLNDLASVLVLFQNPTEFHMADEEGVRRNKD